MTEDTIQLQNEDIIDDLFEYHAPTEDQIKRMKHVREAAKFLAHRLNKACPPSADRTAAMRELQSCVNTANRSIIFEGKSYR